MRASIGQYATRVTCGLGLLLLPAVQQKVCTWPVRQRTEPRQPAEAAATPPPSEQPKKKTSEPPTLAAMLPDVAPPRWPNHTHLASVQRWRPHAVTTWVNSPVGFDDESAGPAGVDSIFADGWPRKPLPQRLRTFGNAGLRLVRVHRHVFRTSILRTGPPCA
jgi:hypothetical protein